MGTDGINETLGRFREAREGARRFHADAIGEGVNPSRCFADFLARVWDDDRGGLEKVYGPCHNHDGHHPVTKAALSESGGATGGYLVPPDIRYDLMKDVAEDALFRPRALVVPMASATCDLSLPDATTPQTAGTAPEFGGVLLSFKPEAAARPETEPQWRRVQLKAWELTGYALASNNLLADGGRALEAVLRRLFARSIAFYEDYYFLRGSGAGQPMGLVNAPASKQVTRQTSSQFTLQDVYSMSGNLLPASWARAVWAVSVSVWQWLLKLNTNAWQVNQPIAEGAGRPHFVLNGQAGFVTEKLPAVGTQGDVALFDPSLYVIGDRGETDIAVSRDEPTAFPKNQSVWRIVHRVDGQPAFGSVLTLQDGSTTASPYTVLV